jgi:hypothetical protein
MLESSLGLHRSCADYNMVLFGFLDTIRKIVKVKAGMTNSLDRMFEHGSCIVYNDL